MRKILLLLFSILSITACSENSITSTVIISLSSDGQYAVSSTSDNKIVLWDIKNKTQKLIAQQANANSPYFIKNTSYFMWQDADNVVHVQNTSGQEVLTFPYFKVYGEVMTSDLKHYFSADEKGTIFSGYGNNKIAIKPYCMGETSTNKPFGLSLSTDEKYLLSNTVNDIDAPLTTETCQKPEKGYEQRSKSLLNGIVVWDVATGKPQAKMASGIFGVISPDMKYVVGVADKGANPVWDTSTGKKLYDNDDLYWGKKIAIPCNVLGYPILDGSLTSAPKKTPNAFVLSYGPYTLSQYDENGVLKNLFTEDELDKLLEGWEVSTTDQDGSDINLSTRNYNPDKITAIRNAVVLKGGKIKTSDTNHCTAYDIRDTIKGPRGFNYEASSPISIKFIDLNGHYLKLYGENRYAVLFTLNNTKVVKYLDLSKDPTTAATEVHASAIDTAPAANILVTGKMVTPGIIVYHYNEATQTLSKMWSSNDGIASALKITIPLGDGIKEFFFSMSAIAAFTLGLGPFLFYLILSLILIKIFRKKYIVILPIFFTLNFLGWVLSGVASFNDCEEMGTIECAGNTLFIFSLALGIFIPWIVKITRTKEKPASQNNR